MPMRLDVGNGEAVTDALAKAGGSVTELSTTDAWAVEPPSTVTGHLGIGRPFRHNR
jgi:hypothetical protein